MRIVNASSNFEHLINGTEMLKNIERYGRTCYKSEERITEDSAHTFVRMLIKRGHESVLEHEKVTVRIICDRGVSHELVRHRIASYSQESTRYCDYGNGDVAFVRPCFLAEDSAAMDLWRKHMLDCERAYHIARSIGWTPQEARSLLPSSLKTEIVMTTNLREWRHFFRLRTAKAAHPQMREVAIPLLVAFKAAVPVVFEDITVES